MNEYKNRIYRETRCWVLKSTERKLWMKASMIGEFIFSNRLHNSSMHCTRWTHMFFNLSRHFCKLFMKHSVNKVTSLPGRTVFYFDMKIVEYSEVQIRNIRLRLLFSYITHTTRWILRLPVYCLLLSSFHLLLYTSIYGSAIPVRTPFHRLFDLLPNLFEDSHNRIKPQQLKINYFGSLG